MKSLKIWCSTCCGGKGVFSHPKTGKRIKCWDCKGKGYKPLKPHFVVTDFIKLHYCGPASIFIIPKVTQETIIFKDYVPIKDKE